MFAMNTKRRRDDDDDHDGLGDESSFKRFRSVEEQQVDHGITQSPISSLDKLFQPSHTPSPSIAITDLQAMTPAPSECANSPERFFDGQYRHSSQPDTTDMDMDMNMDIELEMDNGYDDTDVRSQPEEDSPFGGSLFMRPPMLNTSLSAPYSPHNTGRIPTPIHPNFNRSGMNGLGFPSSGAAGGMSMPSMRTPQQQLQPTWQTVREDKDEDRSRRMPSPISEDEDVADSPIELTQSQMSRLSVSFDEMDTEVDTEADTEGLTIRAAPPTPRSGRKRSGAFTGTGRLVMGFRDDCEKCRLKVPGHYSHFPP